MKRIATIVMVFSLAGCSGDKNDDLKQFVLDSGKDLRGKVEPLPEMAPYKAFIYNAFDLSDPFKPRKLKPSASGGAFEPDMTRPKEPLEAFSLESLKMVGLLQQKNEKYAVIKTPENTIYRVRVGDHLGQNFGKVLAISDTEVKLKETVQDSAGDWAERESSLTLQQER